MAASSSVITAAGYRWMTPSSSTSTRYRPRGRPYFRSGARPRSSSSIRSAVMCPSPPACDLSRVSPRWGNATAGQKEIPVLEDLAEIDRHGHEHQPGQSRTPGGPSRGDAANIRLPAACARGSLGVHGRYRPAGALGQSRRESHRCTRPSCGSRRPSARGAPPMPDFAYNRRGKRRLDHDDPDDLDLDDFAEFDDEPTFAKRNRHRRRLPPADARDHIDRLPDGDRWSTWDQSTAGERGPSPYPAWLVTELAATDTELGILKTGKEADVFLLRRAVPGGGRSCLLAAKRYRAAEHRLFHRDAGYLEGRRTRESRVNRAAANRSTFGRQAIAGQWANAEFGAL